LAFSWPVHDLLVTERRTELGGENDSMDWPVCFPAEMSAGTISVRSYDPADAAELFEPLADERVWEHMSRPAPAGAAALDEVIRSRLADGYRVTFTVRQGGRAVGITSVLFDPRDPAGAEVGGTLLDPGVWGTGVNSEVKRLLLAVIFRHGAQWVQLRTDERNGRSAAAIRKLGATDLGIRQEHLVRRDGTRRQSRIFRLDRPGPSMPT
jgi:RimJ/RimL family protein N-acetyltransferase